MQSVDLTLPTAAENVALDEALLELAEAGAGHDEYFRLWESPEPCVVVGRSSQIDRRRSMWPSAARDRFRSCVAQAAGRRLSRAPAV